MVAVGMYLRVLREKHDWSRAYVAKLAGTHESQLVRIEAGDQDSRGSLLVKLVTVLKGNMDHVQALILNEQATADDGKELAERVVPESEARAFWEQIESDEERAAILRRMMELTDDPKIFARIQGYLDALEGERRREGR